ncbi:MAG: type IV secretory system conjugative DNA transfer family protein [Vitreimonas sp.]
MRRIGAIVFVSAAAAATLMAGTQTLAAIFNNQSALGAPAFRLGQTSIYWPWAGLIWASDFRARFPRPFALFDFILMVGAGAGLLVFAIASSQGLPRLKRHGRNAWAGFDDIAGAGLFAKAGAVLGKINGEILAFDGPGHLLLIGASRSGKGRGHVVPTLLAWPHSVLVLDIKGELASGDPRHAFPGTAGFRETLGPVLRFAPTHAASARFNPLFEVRRGANEVRDVQNIVEIIVDPAGDARHEDFWDRSAKQVLVGLILHVLYCETDHRKTLAVVREKLRDLDAQAEHMRLVLHRRSPETGSPETHPEVLHAAESYLAGEERMRSGIKATAESFFGIFADPLVAANTSASDFRVGDLMCGEKPVSLFLQPPPSDATRLMPLMRLVLNQITRSLMEDQVADASGRSKRHQLLLLLDEFPQLGRLSFFETAMGAFAGYGLKAYLVCQSLNHVTRAYGRDGVIIDNCHVVTAFAAADIETAKTLAAMTGERWEMIEQESVSRPRALLNRRGATSFREERRPLMLPSDVRQLPIGEEIIFVAGVKPIRAQKLRFDDEPVFQSRLKPASWGAQRLTTVHDWQGVRPLGRLVKDKKGSVKVVSALSSTAPVAQGDLFPDLKISEQALAGFRAGAHGGQSRGSGI